MKKIITVVVIAILSAPAIAQETKTTERTITVTGISEKEIVPDEIYVQVDLREYTKKNGDKIDINTIKNNFLAACKSLGLTEKDIAVQDYQGYDNNYWMTKKKKTPDMKASISYWVKVTNTSMLDALVDKMDDEATQNFFIAKSSYSKMDELKKEMKITAIKAAKEKASYLAEAIGEHVGNAITINDPVETGDQPRPIMYANTYMKADMAGNAAPMDVDFKKIKLQFQVTVVFGLN